ncbi:MAG: insulinase family protein [Myxococcota bacterium]|nr:insulinase family protein [Myxococcota bacterium]
MIALLTVLNASAQDDIVTDAATDEAAPAAVAPAPVHEPALKAPVLWAVDAATTAVLVEDHRAPLVQLRIQVPAGNWTPWLIENHGIEAWLRQNYDTDGDLRARADSLAADFYFNVREQRSTMVVRCLKRDLPAVLELVDDILTNTDYDTEELKRMQQGYDIGWKGSQKEHTFRMNQATHRLLFAEGDPRRISYEKPGSVETNSDELVAVRDAMLRLPGRVIGFSGDLTLEEAEAMVGGILPEAEAAPEGMEPVFYPLSVLPESAVESMDNLTQTYFAWFKAGPNWEAEDYAAWRVADHVLGGHNFSRLNVALRHDGGETYGVRTAGRGSENERVYSISTFTRLENTESTEEKLRAALATFHSEGISAEELDGAIGYWLGSRLSDKQSPNQILNETLWALGNDRTIDWKDDLNEAIAALTVEDVNAAITEHFAPESFTMLRVTEE